MGPLCSHSNQQVTLNSMISIELIKNKCSDSHMCLGLFDDVPNFSFINFISIRHLFKSVCKFVTWLLCTYLKRDSPALSTENQIKTVGIFSF